MHEVKLENVWLEYPILGISGRSLRNSLFHRVVGAELKRTENRITVPALQDISFAVSSGDRVAIFGPNGSGKSTLLKVLAGIYKPQKGAVTVEGEAVALFNSGLFVSPEVSGYENIKMACFLMGLHASEVDGLRDEIAEFSGLGEYLHMPIRTYSAGMMTRLHFAIITTMQAEILLLDEVISAGDQDFQKKAGERIKNMSANSKILFIALHDINTLRELCDKAIWLDGGKLMAFGDFDDVAAARDEQDR